MGVQILVAQPLGSRGWFSAIFAFSVASALGAVAIQQWIAVRPHDAQMLRPWQRISWWSWALGVIAFALAWTLS